MRSTVYIETTIPSLLTANLSSDVVVLARQITTRRWWDERRGSFDLRTSELVAAEASQGDPSAAARRLKVIDPIESLPLDPTITSLANRVAVDLDLPTKALADSVHIAVCLFHRVDYLLTWNCRHIANASHQTKIRRIASEVNLPCPVICTPDELLS